MISLLFFGFVIDSELSREELGENIVGRMSCCIARLHLVSKKNRIGIYIKFTNNILKDIQQIQELTHKKRKKKFFCGYCSLIKHNLETMKNFC